MKIFSASAFLLLVNGSPAFDSDLTEFVNNYRRIRRSGTPSEKLVHHRNQSIRSAISRMDPLNLSGREQFILNKLMRKGAHKVTEPRIYAAFNEIDPTQEEMEAFTELQSHLISKAQSADDVRLALVGLDSETVAVDGFFSAEKRLEGLRQATFLEMNMEREKQKLEKDIQLKMGEDFLEDMVDLPKGKGMEKFLRVDNMSYDQQYKIAQWMRNKPDAKLSEKRLGKLLRKSPMPSIRELNNFHVMQQRVLRGEFHNDWTDRLMETIWKGLKPDPVQ